MGEEVVLMSVSFGLEDCGVVTAALLMPATAARVHVKLAPLEDEAGVYVNDVLLQTADGVNELLNTGADAGVKETESEAMPLATTTKE